MLVLLASASVVRMSSILTALADANRIKQDKCLLHVYSVETLLMIRQWTCPKHVQYFIKKISEIVHFVGFYYKSVPRCTVL